ncbi:MAG TPA: DUF2934 domain-containing protein [Nitrospira sp.]|nr:DUF2934 domain-containing protein [Nitrospira sp.]
MQPQTVKEPRKRKSAQSIQEKESAGSEKEPVHCQPVSPCDDLQARITSRAHELYVDRGYREGRALDDWLEAEREVLGLECNA